MIGAPYEEKLQNTPANSHDIEFQKGQTDHDNLET